MEQTRTIRALRAELASVQAKLDALAAHSAQSTAKCNPLPDTDIASRIALLRHLEVRVRPIKQRTAIADHASVPVSYPVWTLAETERIAAKT